MWPFEELQFFSSSAYMLHCSALEAAAPALSERANPDFSRGLDGPALEQCQP